MSNRTPDKISALAELKFSHELQIEALTAPGLDKGERIRRFFEAMGVVEVAPPLETPSHGVACHVWSFGAFSKSLFAYLPGCCCPVQEKDRLFWDNPLIPAMLSPDWSPTREVLEEFARIQQEARFPS